MIYFTGDLHGDRTRLEEKKIKRLRRGDTLVVCGDFGFVWDNSSEERKLLTWIGKRRYNVVFVEGVHDNMALLEKYPVERWNGGLTHHICGNLRHLIRGQAYNINGKVLFAFGGGEDEDQAILQEASVDWRSQELPTAQELQRAWTAVRMLDKKIDYVVSHHPPSNIASCITNHTGEVSSLTAFLDKLQMQCQFQGWYFGGYHQNKIIPPYYYCLFDDVVPGK